MAKTAKLKKRQSTVHTRAARRAQSPSPDLSLNPTTTPRTSNHPSTSTTSTIPPKSHNILSAHTSAGISKKSKNKPQKRQQRLRQQNAIERAADNFDKLELKVLKSVGRDRKVRERRKGWEEVNSRGTGGSKGVKGRRGNAFEGLGEEGGEGEGDDGEGKRRVWGEDEDMERLGGEEGRDRDGDLDLGVSGDVELVPEISGEVKQVIVPESVPLPVVTAEEDEML